MPLVHQVVPLYGPLAFYYVWVPLPLGPNERHMQRKSLAHEEVLMSMTSERKSSVRGPLRHGSPGLATGSHGWPFSRVVRFLPVGISASNRDDSRIELKRSPEGNDTLVDSLESSKGVEP